MVKPGTGTAQALIVWVISYIFFISGLANNLSASHDSINYLNHISRGEHLFHQHHLLYHFIAHGWLKCLSMILPGVQQHHIVEAFTALWGSAVIAICFLFFRNRFMLTPPMALAGIAAIIFSYGSWFYSINVEVYTPPAFFILYALYVMTKGSHRQYDLVLVAVLHALAILFHQVNVLFFTVAIYWVVKASNKDILKRLLRYFALVGILAGGVYLVIGWYVEGNGSLYLFGRWVMGYTVGHNYWQPLSLATIPKTVAGIARAFIGAQFIFQIPQVKGILQSSLSGHGLEDEIFLTRNLPGYAAWLLTALTLLIGASIGTMIVRFCMCYRKMRMRHNVIKPLLATIIVYSVFFMFWMPEILEFWILQMVIVWLLVVGMLPEMKFPFRISNFYGMLMIAASLFVVNYFGSIRWLRSFENDWYFQQVTNLGATKGDLVIIEDKWILKDYVRYFKKVQVMATDEAGNSRERINKAIQYTITNGGKVFKNTPEGEGGWTVIQSY